MTEERGAERRARPVCLPDSFSGEGSFEDWSAHFETVATLNDWNEADKLRWMIVRLTGRAQTAFRRFPEEAQQSYGAAVKALKERFEPPAKKDMYAAELQVRHKEKLETWGDFGDAIKTLVDRAFPSLEPAAKEIIALNHYLSHLGNPQVEFAVKQRRPQSVIEAISFTIEAESYLPKPGRVSYVESSESVLPPSSHGASVSAVQEHELSIAAVREQQSAMMGILERMTKRLEKLEGHLTPSQTAEGTWRDKEYRAGNKESARAPVICHKCKKEGHYARGCAANRSKNLGN